MSDPYERLDAAMARRRLDLDMKTWRDLAQAAGISYETLRAFRKGEGAPASATVHGIERALRWQSGSIESMLAGREPSPIAEPGSLPPLTADVRGTVTDPEEEEPDSPITSDIEKLLQLAKLQVEELKAIRAQMDEQGRQIEEMRREKEEPDNGSRRKRA